MHLWKPKDAFVKHYHVPKINILFRIYFGNAINKLFYSLQKLNSEINKYPSSVIVNKGTTRYCSTHVLFNCD